MTLRLRYAPVADLLTFLCAGFKNDGAVVRILDILMKEHGHGKCFIASSTASKCKI